MYNLNFIQKILISCKKYIYLKVVILTNVTLTNCQTFQSLNLSRNLSKSFNKSLGLKKGQPRAILLEFFEPKVIEAFFLFIQNWGHFRLQSLEPNWHF